jgi:hypothetical protein
MMPIGGAEDGAAYPMGEEHVGIFFYEYMVRKGGVWLTPEK